jgi:hypothetical protein
LDEADAVVEKLPVAPPALTETLPSLPIAKFEAELGPATVTLVDTEMLLPAGPSKLTSVGE